jgi:queuosine precursor transporter
MIWPVAFITTIFAANWAIAHFGLVPVGFGLVAPAGVYFAGLAFTFRDLTQERLGRRAVLSALVSARFAMASGLAFLLSEGADFAVYTPLRGRGWLRAVFASNVIGLVVDSVVFLWLAFGSVAYLPGQVIGKLWVTLLAVAALAAYRAISRAA